MKLLGFIKSRVGERSTWVGIGMAVSAAAVLPWPWSAIAFAAGVVSSFVPDGKVGS